MRVLVLGGTGFLGPHIVRQLKASGHEVSVFCRGSGGDRNRLDRSRDEFVRLRPDVVVDMIAFTAQHGESLRAVFQGIARRVVVLSSGDVYRANDILFGRVPGAIEPTPLKETSPLRERLFPYRGTPTPNPYDFPLDDYDKILVERAVSGHPHLPATVLRLPMVYGPGAHQMAQRRFFAYLKRMEDGRPAILMDARTAKWKAPWGYAEDVAAAVRLAVENDASPGEVYNVCERESLSLESWVAELGKAAGWTGRIVTTDQACPPPSLPRALNLDQHLDMDSTKIRRELGYRETVPRPEALQSSVAWEREHPPESIDPAQFDYAAEDAILRGIHCST